MTTTDIGHRARSYWQQQLPPGWTIEHTARGWDLLYAPVNGPTIEHPAHRDPSYLVRWATSIDSAMREAAAQQNLQDVLEGS